MSVQQGLFGTDEKADGDGRSGAVPWLCEVDPGQWAVGDGWRSLVDGFLAGATGRDLMTFLRDRVREGAVVYPPQPLRALSRGGPASVRVVIVGQDPYHGPGQAEGLAFSVAPGVRHPPSLRNIFKELRRDLGLAVPVSGSLMPWVDQDVLLLNTCLTVEDGRAGSHAGRGWEALTDAVIAACNASGGDMVFMLWGAHAQKKLPMIDRSRHEVLCANHPSPLSASRGPVPFLGCGHFGAANRWLSTRGRKAVDWKLVD